ncbi:MAG: protease inhibitor I42 family protein [Ginsengibacter sp.]
MAGYEWSYIIVGDKDCIKGSKDLDLPEKSTQKNTGISADEIFTISGKNKGVANIHFTQQRSWEKKAEPVNERKVKVTIE